MAGPWVKRGTLRDMLLPSGIDLLKEYRIGLDGAKNVIDVVEHVFRNEGLSRNAAAAAVVNAFVESRLDPSMEQVGGAGGVGLFQITGNGPGKGTKLQRKDPIFNATYIARNELAKSAFGYAFREADKAGSDIPTLTKIFARDIERCACCGYPHVFERGEERTIRRTTLSKSCKGNKTLERDARVKLSKVLFPKSVTDKHGAEAADLSVRLGADDTSGFPWGSLLVATGTLLVVAGIEYRKGV